MICMMMAHQYQSRYDNVMLGSQCSLCMGGGQLAAWNCFRFSSPDDQRCRKGCETVGPIEEGLGEQATINPHTQPAQRLSAPYLHPMSPAHTCSPNGALRTSCASCPCQPAREPAPRSAPLTEKQPAVPQRRRSRCASCHLSPPL